MKLTIKTFRQETFEINIDPNKTIYDLKCYLQEKSNNQLPSDSITLIYSGLILDDQNLIKSYNINEDKFIVVLMRSISTNKTEQSQQEQQNELQSKKSTIVDFKTNNNDKTIPHASKNFTNITAEARNNPSTALSLQTVSNPSNDRFRSTERLINTEQINRSIQNIVDAFGYPENEVRHAFSASFNNPDVAVDFLLNGIPSSELVHIGLDLGAIETSLSDEWHDFIADTTAAITAATTSNNTPTTPTTPTTTTTATATTATTATETTPSPIDFLRTNPRFERMRLAMRNDPNLFETVINRIENTNIGLLNLIRENQDDFINMINEPIDGIDNDNDIGEQSNNIVNPAYQVSGHRFIQSVVVTPEDEEAIKRLMDLGFSDYLCVEAYFVCDKDEERAANFLLSQTEQEQQ